MTYDQAAARKDKAERFVRNVLQDDDRADEIADESVSLARIENVTSLAIHWKGTHHIWQMATEIRARRPSYWTRSTNSSKTTKTCKTRLDAIADIVVPPDEGDEDDYDDDSDDNGQD